MTDAPQPRARTVRDFCRAYGIGRNMAYELIKAGRIVAVKAGTRTLIDEASAIAWYESLPRPGAQNSAHIPAHIPNADSSKRRRTRAGGNGTKTETAQ